MRMLDAAGLAIDLVDATNGDFPGLCGGAGDADHQCSGAVVQAGREVDTVAEGNAPMAAF